MKYLAGVAVGASAVVLAACGHAEPTTPNTAPPANPGRLNGVSASQLVDAITKAGLPAPNARDVTAPNCQQARCIQEIDTDTVSILKFPGTGPAQLYEGAMANVYQVEDLVLVFAPAVTADSRRDYERVAEHLVK
jgi:hypothetical protein